MKQIGTGNYIIPRDHDVIFRYGTLKAALRDAKIFLDDDQKITVYECSDVKDKTTWLPVTGYCSMLGETYRVFSA